MNTPIECAGTPPTQREGRNVDVAATTLAGTVENFNAVWAVRDARNASLKLAHKAVLYAIASRLRTADDEAYPSLPTIAADAGAGVAQTKVLIGELTSWGVLQKRVVVDSRGRHNSYVIDFDVLARVDPFARARRKRPPPAWRGSANAPADGWAGAPADGWAGAPAHGARGSDGASSDRWAGAPADGWAGAPADGGAGAPAHGSGGSDGASSDGWDGAAAMKIQMEDTRDHIQISRSAPPSAPRPGGAGTRKPPQRLDSVPNRVRTSPNNDVQGTLFANAVSSAAPESDRRKPPSPRKPPAPSSPVVEAYILAYTEANGCAPPMGAADNTAAKRLVDQMGAGAAVEFIHDVFANDRVRQRYPSIRRLASDPAAVRAELTAVDEAHEITDQELEQAQALARANPDHPVVRTLRAQAERAGLKKVVPSRRQFEWLVSQPDAGRRNKQHAPQQDASFEVHPAWREG